MTFFCRTFPQRAPQGGVTKVYEYLVSQAGTSLKNRDQLKDLLKDLKPFNLSRAEQVQVLNLAPSTAVEVHLVVDSCEQRLSEEQVEQLVQIVARHLSNSSIPT
eukprot:gene13206-13337_t